MKFSFYLYFIYFIYYSNSLPHFIYDGIESFHQCSNEEDEIFLTIYGTLIGNIGQSKIIIEDYSLKHIGKLKCSFSDNEQPINEKRKHKIVCSIRGSFPRFSYIIEEPQVKGFDFLNEKGESSWPKIEEKKTFIIGECGSKIELDDEPLLLSSSSSSPYSNPIEKVRKSIIDAVLASLPPRNAINELKMSIAMKNYKEKYSLNEAECAYLVYKWIAENIEYDCYGSHRGQADHGESLTYNKGKGVCAGMTYIFKTLTRFLGLDVEYISGYSKSINGGSSGNSHAWNAVKIDSIYYLVDVTWGGGGCNGDIYKKSFKESYFCQNPEAFIRRHFPAEPKWQLLQNTITYQQFDNMAFLYPNFFENGLKTISPDARVITVQGKGKINMTYDESLTNLVISCKVTNYKENYPESNACIWWKEKGNIEINFYANDKETYALNIYSKVNKDESSYIIGKILINNNQTVNPPQYYPEEYDLGTDVKLIEPLNGSLTKGTFVDIKIESVLYENFYALVGYNFKRKLEKQSDGTFIAESLYIFDDKVTLSLKEGGTYHTLYLFNNVKNPEILEEPTFPISFNDLPPHVLYSPLMDTLKKGNSYIFQIKCKTAIRFDVYDGIDYYELSKNGNIFSGNITIKGNDSNDGLIIVGYLENSTNMRYFYIYIIS